jgi:Holliday junction resolvase
MIFSIQNYLEDYFHRRNLRDLDQYAVKIANRYARRRKSESESAFLNGMRRLQTTFYKNNSSLNRNAVERDILNRLDYKFQKGNPGAIDQLFGAGLALERTRLRRMQRRTIGAILQSFRRATQARTIDALWSSRQAGQLRSRPEKIAQALFTQFLLGVLSNKGGQVFRELASGVGFVDVIVMLGSVPHLVELKILRGPFTGPAQLESYMVDENRREGWLVVFDARQTSRKSPLPKVISRPGGNIKIVVIEINPVAPSRRKDS